MKREKLIMDYTDQAMKLPTTPFSINDILTAPHNQANLSKKLKQICRFRRSSLDCFIVSKNNGTENTNDESEKSYVQMYNNPLDMRKGFGCHHSEINVSGEEKYPFIKVFPFYFVGSVEGNTQFT